MATDTDNVKEKDTWDVLRDDLRQLIKNRGKLAAETARAQAILAQLSSELAKVDYTVKWLESWVKLHEPKDVSDNNAS